MTTPPAPRAHRLERRLGRRGTIHLVVLVAALAAYTALAVGVALDGWLVRLDHEVAELVFPVQDGWLTSLADALGAAGRTPIQVAGLAIALAALTVRHRRIGPLVLATFAVFLLVVLVIAFKASMGRIGPLDDPGHVPWGGAFPSGHAATAVVVPAVLVLVLRDHVSVKVRQWLIVAVVTWSGLVGWSRVHLDRHWLSDVVAGWALGIVVVCATGVAAELFSRTPRDRLP